MLKIQALLYHIVKPIIRIALLFFCRKIYFNTKKYLNNNGPLLLAVNHPNSFLDAIIVGVFFKQPVYFLARGDAFHKKWQLNILTSLKCIPVYRIREGKQYLHLNESTFEKCRQIFKKGGIVLIFSEGLCINEWNLRPLKKGTARLAISSWEMPEIGDRLNILPVGINYSSFSRGPKKIYINFGNMIHKEEFTGYTNEGLVYTEINRKIGFQLNNLCFDGIKNIATKNLLFSCLISNADQFCKNEYETIKRNCEKINLFEPLFPITDKMHHISLSAADRKKSFFKAFLLFFLSFPAMLVYLPPYLFCKKIIKRKSGKSGHYDSILFGFSALFFCMLQPFILIFSFFLLKKLSFAIVFTLGLLFSSYFLTKFMIYWQRFWNFNYLKNEQRLSLQCLTK